MYCQRKLNFSMIKIPIQGLQGILFIALTKYESNIKLIYCRILIGFVNILWHDWLLFPVQDGKRNPCHCWILMSDSTTRHNTLKLPHHYNVTYLLYPEVCPWNLPLFCLSSKQGNQGQEETTLLLAFTDDQNICFIILFLLFQVR